MALKTIVLGPGDCAVLPSGATIVSLTANGSITATSDCTLPEPGVFKCWRFKWEDDSGDAAHDDTFFTAVKIGTTTYNVDGAPVPAANTYDNGADFLYQAIPISTPAGLVIDISSSGGTAANPKCLIFSIPDSLGQPIIYWSNPGYETGAFFGEEDECEC